MKTLLDELLDNLERHGKSQKDILFITYAERFVRDIYRDEMLFGVRSVSISWEEFERESKNIITFSEDGFWTEEREHINPHLCICGKNWWMDWDDPYGEHAFRWIFNEFPQNACRTPEFLTLKWP